MEEGIGDRNKLHLCRAGSSVPTGVPFASIPVTRWLCHAHSEKELDGAERHLDLQWQATSKNAELGQQTARPNYPVFANSVAETVENYPSPLERFTDSVCEEHGSIRAA